MYDHGGANTLAQVSSVASTVRPKAPITEGSLEVECPTHGKMQQVSPVGREKLRREETQKRRRSEEKKIQKKEDPSAQNVAKHCVSPVFRGFGGSKGRLVKAVGAEGSRDMMAQNLHHAAARAIGESTSLKTGSLARLGS